MRLSLDLPRIETALRESSVTQMLCHDQIDSTNTAALALDAPGALVLAEHQVGGKGRLGREWTETPRAGLAMSLRVPVPPHAVGWVPLLTGLALRTAVARETAYRADLKWPNDLLAASGGKLAGILCEMTPDAIVIGAGLNVDHTREELPVPTATSLALELGRPMGEIDRSALVIAYVQELTTLLAALHTGRGELRAAQEAYRAACSTIGARITVQTQGAPVAAEATGVDDDGRLLVRDQAGATRAIAAGDVHHVRVAE